METMIRPDGHPLHPEDGWAEQGCPLTIQHSQAVERFEWDGAATIPWTRIITEHKRVSRKSAAPLWSFCLVSNRARRISSVTHGTALVYDFDAKGGRDFADVVDGLLGVRWFAHTTFSHSLEAHCFRLILPVAEAIPVDEYRDALEAVADVLGLWGRDPACKDPSRLYYIPSCAPDAEPWLEYQDGDCMDWRGWLQAARVKAIPEVIPTVRPTPPMRRSPREGRDSPEWERQRARYVAEIMLDLKHPDCSMQPWLESIFSIVDALGQEGYDMIEAWSRRGTKYDPRQMAHLRRRLRV